MALKAGGRGRGAKTGKPDWSKRTRDRKAKTEVVETVVEAVPEVQAKAKKQSKVPAPAPLPLEGRATRGTRAGRGDVSAAPPEPKKAKPKAKPKAPPAPLGSAEPPSPQGGGEAKPKLAPESPASPAAAFDPTSFLDAEQRDLDARRRALRDQRRFNEENGFYGR